MRTGSAENANGHAGSVKWLRSSCKRTRLSGRLEQLDRIPRRIVEHDLRAAGAGHDFAAEADARRAEPLDLACDVVHEQVNAVPASRCWPASVWHGAGRRAGGATQEEVEVA